MPNEHKLQISPTQAAGAGIRGTCRQGNPDERRVPVAHTTKEGEQHADLVLYLQHQSREPNSGRSEVPDQHKLHFGPTQAAGAGI